MTNFGDGINNHVIRRSAVRRVSKDALAVIQLPGLHRIAFSV